MMLPICREPYPDELFYGYVRSLACANGVDRMSDMEALFLHGGSKNAHVHVRYPTGLAKICSMVQNRTFPRLRSALYMTPYYSEAFGMPKRQQAKLAETIIQSESPAVPKMSPEKEWIQLCPQCWAEDEARYGEGYVHVSHHFPGITVCKKHQRPLVRIKPELKRKLMKELSPELGTKMEVADFEGARKHTDKMEETFQNSIFLLQEKRCGVCGKSYLEHPYSGETLAGCPFCNEHQSPKDIIQRRLCTQYGSEYRVESGFTSIHEAVVIHVPCGTKQKKLSHLLYEEENWCRECRKLTSKRLQQRFDPDEKNWIFYENSPDDRKRKRIHVKHKQCGQDAFVFMPQFTKKESGWCPYCDGQNKSIAISDIDGAYELASGYKNNREMVKIRHKDCGIVFETSKTSFLAGTRCPVCTPRYDFESVAAAIESCTEGYEVIKERKRGYASVRMPNGVLLAHLSYSILMNDLKSEIPFIFRDRKCQYIEIRSIRRKIFDSVKAETERKGWWGFSDKIDGQKVSRSMRNLVQDMARLGYIKRIGTGKYITEGQK